MNIISVPREEVNITAHQSAQFPVLKNLHKNQRARRIHQILLLERMRYCCPVERKVVKVNGYHHTCSGLQYSHIHHRICVFSPGNSKQNNISFNFFKHFIFIISAAEMQDYFQRMFDENGKGTAFEIFFRRSRLF